MAKDDGGRGYGMPLNYVWDGADALYIHCAPDGEKLRVISANPDVSFCVVGKKCRAVTGLDDDEKTRALRLLVAKLSPGHEELGMKYSQKSFHRVEIIRLDVIEASGKRKKVF